MNSPNRFTFLLMLAHQNLCLVVDDHDLFVEINLNNNKNKN